MMTEAAWNADVESRIEAFESAWQRQESVDIGSFLPSVADSLFLPVLCELVRIDMELRWSKRMPRTLEMYLQEFPQLRNDSDAIQQVAFEEFRQRL
jgi:hypothetical protein